MLKRKFEDMQPSNTQLIQVVTAINAMWHEKNQFDYERNKKNNIGVFRNKKSKDISLSEFIAFFNAKIGKITEESIRKILSDNPGTIAITALREIYVLSSGKELIDYPAREKMKQKAREYLREDSSIFPIEAIREPEKQETNKLSISFLLN